MQILKKYWWLVLLILIVVVWVIVVALPEGEIDTENDITDPVIEQVDEVENDVEKNDEDAAIDEKTNDNEDCE